MKHTVDIETWERRDNYAFFRNFLNSWISVATEIDCTEARAAAKAAGRSFFLYYLYAVLRAVNEIKEFRYRTDSRGNVIWHDTVDVISPIAVPGRTFYTVRIPYHADFERFYAEARAIVTDIPGTTRDTIEESIKIGGVPLVLMDTAGLRETDNRVEQIGIERARASMEKADLILAVIDGSQPLTPDDRNLLSSLKGRNAIVILNKYDLPQEIEIEDVRELSGNIPCIRLSAQYGSGMDDLKEELRKITGHQDADAGRELFLTNLRHVDLVKKSLASVERALESVRNGMPADCIVVDLTEAWTQMGAITGDTVDDELINGIFERFCVGK